MGSVFTSELRIRLVGSQKRKIWFFVPYDQLHGELALWEKWEPNEIGMILIESVWKGNRRPYHRQKLALILANMRHFAIEQAERGVAIHHVRTSHSYRIALESLANELGPIHMMEPAERELRVDIAPLMHRGLLHIHPHSGWLTTREQFLRAAAKGPPFRMDAFYRLVRRETGILMERGKPIGGKFSFDAANRRPWNGNPPAAIPPEFPSSPIKCEVGDLIERDFAHHPGQFDLKHLPATLADAESLWQWAQQNCLPVFGPYEDAMSTRSTTLFHTRLSSLLNLHRLLPLRVLKDVLQLDIPLESKEGFVRQLLGWREFVRHVHRETDGFRRLGSVRVPVQPKPGDGGLHRWTGKKWTSPADPGEGMQRNISERKGDQKNSGDVLDGGAAPNFLRADQPLPVAFWGQRSGLECLDRVVADVWREGYSHHITRLMILANLASLLDVNPRELTDWFWVAYTDAFDWVVEPNVLGMGTYAVGDWMTTKPYICGSAYIHRMSDYCSSCRFDPNKNCPITSLYWAFLDRYRSALGNNDRMRLPLVSLAKRSATERDRDIQVYQIVSQTLSEGKILNPADLENPAANPLTEPAIQEPRNRRPPRRRSEEEWRS